jgi:hypothetical protein
MSSVFIKYIYFPKKGGASIEARYFFTSFLGAYLKHGYSGLQILGAGLTVKF